MKKNAELRIFLVSFVIILVYGLLLSYNYRMDTNYNLLFESDTGRVIADATEILENHYRLDVHPLFVLFVQPVVFLLKGIVLDKVLAIIILSALVSALSIVYLYKILSLINKDNSINLLLCGIYLFSFSNIIFTSGIEVYNFATLFLLVLWYYFIKKQKEDYSFSSYIILIILGILSMAFTITNVVVYLIILFILLISKKTKLKNILIIGIVTLISFIALNVGQKVIWRNTPLIWRTRVSNETSNYTNLDINKKMFKNVLVEDYYNSLISSNLNLKIKYGNEYHNDNYVLVFNNISFMHFLLISVFYILLIFLIVRNYKKNKNINRGLLLGLCFNTILHLVYGNNAPFLYSLHFLYLIILLFGINLSKEDNIYLKSFSNIFLFIFFIAEFVNNNIVFSRLLEFVNSIINKNIILGKYGFTKTIIVELLIIFFIIAIIKLLLFLCKLIKEEKKKELKYIYIIVLVLVFFSLEVPFIFVERIKNNIDDTSIGSIIPKNRYDYLSKSFKDHFKVELKDINDYSKEIELLKSEFDVVSSPRFNWSDYYYFGMANRRKILYRENEIVDIDTKKVIYQFEEKERYILPNKYMVLIKTKNNDFIKIFEDELGVHFNKNDKDEIIEGTNTKIELYSFSEYRYKNLLKSLYGELLFNIKDSVIYPNIIVYNKPWYRDAALACMVLKKTNNTNLIKDWVINIDEIYDKQNNGISEPDNLGELLYILSTQEEKNVELINNIENEAYRLAESNENGYYIYGKTDFGDMHLYQNLWYKLGIESIGRSFDFDLNNIPEDFYTKMAWWSDYETSDDTYEVSLEYPYLSYAMRHKLNNGQIAINESYPLSYEINASEAKYENYKGLDNNMINMHTSPLHTWAAAELILLLMDNN